MEAIVQQLTEQASHWEPESNQLFSLHEAGKAWIVQQGKLDVFLVNTQTGEAGGARHHVMRIEAGELVLGVGPHGEDGGVCMMAAAAPETRVFVLAVGQLRGTPEANGSVLELLEEWIDRFADAAVHHVPPPQSTVLDPGAKLTVKDDPRAVLPARRVQWLTVNQGQAFLVGNRDLPAVASTGPFPFSWNGWLHLEAKTSVHSISTAEWAAEDPEWSALEGFHRAALSHLLLHYRRSLEADERRMRRRSDNDSAAVDASLRLLAAPLAERKAVVVSEDLSDDPLLIACQAVGQAAGIAVRPNPDLQRGVRVKNAVEAIGRTSGFRVRRVVLKGNWFRRSSGPMLAFRDSDNRPVALLPRSVWGYDVYDPVEKTTSRLSKSLADTLNGFGYVFYRPFPSTALDAGDLIEFGLHGARSELGIILLMGVASGLLGMVTPIATGIIFDTVIPGAQRSQLLQLATFLAAAAIATALFTLTRSFALLRLEGKMDATIQAAVWDRLLSLPVPFFRDYTAGDLAVRGMGINQIRLTLTGSTLTSILSGFFSIFSFALLFYYSWRLAILATVLILISFLFSMWSGYVQVRHQRNMSAVRGRISGMVLQFINGISKFRISGTEGRAFAAWAREFTHQKQISLNSLKGGNRLEVFNAMFPIVATAGIFYYSAELMRDPQAPPLSTGDFLAFNAAFGQFLSAMLQLSMSIVGVLNIVPLYERAKPIFQTLPEVDEGKADPGELKGNIEVNHLAFRYRPDAPLVLRDISLSIKAGQFVAFVGSSGCGKSTLFRLLLGFERPESGAIYFDGQDLAGVDVGSVRRQMGVVLQNGRLLSGDIFTNIIGSAPLTLDDAWQAAEMAGLADDIRGMPMGMHTVIAEGGGGLSGGQRQRLLIARAIVGRPRILLFDEATSALDNQTQAIVSQSLEKLQATRVVIAHRLSTIINADRIFVFDKGLVVQSGSYAELMEQQGVFAELAKRQI
ncbi:MAG: NHLP bacteriocin export ABC transporter permease/ATPase subunit [Bryobacteraceae bacterium]